MMKKKIKTITIAVLGLSLLSLFGCQKESSQEAATPNYTNFKVLSVKVSAMPFADATGDNWDELSGPDVFFKMELANNSVLYDGTSARYADVATNALPLSWNFVSAYQITNIAVTQYVTVYDYDTPDPDDRIGYVSFTMSEHKSGYPKTITKSNNGVTVTITGEWY